MKRTRILFMGLCALLCATGSARAQYELKSGNFNNLHQGPVPTAPNPAPSSGQFSSVAPLSGAAGPISTSSTFADRFPSNAANTLVLQKASIGNTFAAGVPRYALGDIIVPPLVKADGVTPADANYWRPQPVLPGEIIAGYGTPIPLGTVSVTSASINSTTVTVASVPAELVVGSSLLGQPVTRVVGNTVTLAANSSNSVSSATNFPITPATSFYYSPHAEKVFAHQPGRVEIKWVTRVPDGANYGVRDETFAVSANTSRPIRTIFWTEGTFDGPKVQITDGRITTVNPVYNSQVPKAVAEEVSIPGNSPASPNLTTLSFNKFNGVGQLQAYNVEGRLLVEYLGNVRSATGTYEFVGTEVVEMKRVASVGYPSIHLGKEIVSGNGDTRLVPSPVLSNQQSGGSYYGTVVRPDQTLSYFAEKETSPANNPDDGSPSSPNEAYNKVVFYWLEAGDFNIKWPHHQDRYWLRWSPNLADYAHYTVDSSGSTPETGISFASGVMPQLVYQDDASQTEAALDVNTQRFHVNPGADQRNRALLKFNGNGETWYVNIYSQAESRQKELAATTPASPPDPDTTVVTVSSTAELEVGMVVSGAGINGTATIVAILNGTQYVISQQVPGLNGPLVHTVQSDLLAAINTSATVGTRLQAPAGHENAGFISSGTGYYPAGYINPVVSGIPAANLGAIIPVNARPGDSSLTVRWYKKIKAPSSAFQDLYVPGKIGRYTIGFPASTSPEIVIAKGVGTDDLPPAESTGFVYYQNDSTRAGYNPNEEHALMLGGRAYALRDDLNVTSGGSYTSQPCVLVAYTDPADKRPAMHAYKVVRSNATYNFDYVSTAGTLLVKPYPLPLLPLPLTGSGTTLRSKDLEIVGADAPANATVAEDDAYRGFTFQDRKGFTWVHRGPHDAGSPTLTMKLYYVMQDGFFIPGQTPQPSAGTILPFLRNPGRSGQALNLGLIDNGQQDQPLAIIYRPAWPTQAAELRVAETLTLPKFGLPQVRGQATASILYQQSIAKAATSTGLSKTSVTLHDPTREKTVALDAAAVGLAEIPASIATTTDQGKVYFQGLPPHLQERFYLDPSRGAKGTLVLLGSFHDEPAGEDYLDLNLLSAGDEEALKGLADSSDANKSKWNTAIDALATQVETFKENPAVAGTYIVDQTKTVNVGENDLTVIDSPETAVDSYAVTATGQGTGFVTMVFGNGDAFAPEEDPVQVKVFKVAPQLYTGDLKVISSSNPLDEQVTLRHSGDFAGKPEDYEFEWRWTTGAATAPAVYETTINTRIGNPADNTHRWKIVSDPGAMRPVAEQYTNAPVFDLPRNQNVRPDGYTNEEKNAGLPTLVLKSESGVDFSEGVPGEIFFSASVGTQDGFVFYVNGTPAVAYRAPEALFGLVNASSGLSPAGLSLQFAVPSSYFTVGQNTIEVAIYSSADPNVNSTLDFRLEAATEEDAVENGSVWQTAADPEGKNTNLAIVGGSPLNPFGGSPFVLNDRWFTVRYKPKASADNVLGSETWSRWMQPMLVEGWVKRVLAAINPFEQRVKDLYNSSVNTDVSVLTQAGTRWEGDVALTLSNINDVGLIAIYETVLNRAKSMSIDANTNDPDANNALTLAAGYLNDLYTFLGNEAYADAANPTISVDDQNGSAAVNTSRFSFEGQVASSLDEELALLRGRDDSVSPGVSTAPAYNRLYWNYTRGINSGEAIYALNYNIKEKVGSTTANGVIDEADAQRMFPQGHGDSYGHYLTAASNYYKLLSNPNFTWTPRAEAVTVLGQPVTVDYYDERKLASAAGNLARTAEQIVGLTWRKQYVDSPSKGWSQFRDNRGMNSQTGVTSRQGLDEWVSRGAQGALFHWAVVNSLLPVEDNVHTGIQKIDRSTVPELQALPTAASSFQTSMDSANAHLNPLGLSPDAIAFDISRADLEDGVSHYEQISGRAVTALNNAAGAFNQAAVMTGSLRTQENSLDEFNTSIVEQEGAFMDELVGVFGRPYTGEVGAGKLYAQGYEGPDLFHWYIVDRPNDLVDTSATLTLTLPEAKEYSAFTSNRIDDIVKGLDAQTAVTNRTVTIKPSSYVQYNDVWKPGGLGSRPETGELQDALLDAQQSWLALSEARTNLLKENANLRQSILVFNDVVAMHEKHLSEMDSTGDKIQVLEGVKLALETAAAGFEANSEAAEDVGDTLSEFFPKIVGLAADPSFAARGAAKATAETIAKVMKVLSIAAEASAGGTGIAILNEEQELEYTLEQLGFSNEEKQLAAEFASAYRDYTSHAHEVMQLSIEHQRALQNVSNVLAKGNSILSNREIFRQRAAAVIQGYRTRDVTFRLFRNEALEQYRSLFDLASRYSYLAAKSYDYETGLLGSAQGQGVFKNIVASRALGDLTNGTPQLTTSSLGDAGLAGSMAKLNADFSVAEGRLGINNPDRNGTVFSLRGELFRIRTDQSLTGDDEAWQQTLEQHIKANVLSDPDVASFCRNIRKPDGTPVPGIVIPFSTTIQHGKNFFGLDLAAGDHNFTPSNFATKIYDIGISLPGYAGMDAYAAGQQQAGAPASGATNALSATPYVYVIPCGLDYMLAPPLGDTNTLRSWKVEDQALPLPFNLGANDFNSTQFFSANGTLSEKPWIVRKHQAFRAVDDPSFFYGSVPAEFTNSRLVGRSVWNGQWKIVIPAYTLLNNEQEGLNRFAASVKDIQLFLRTYSNSGN
ncbi:hypothetical protein [Luteolibacter luteus]|uniref:Uncharacterized protein n=1 Tax=Luteolibacter luteus TaxID=2728835 RepID=A0A858RKE2_9BACT|nr:hypothetical protein [Luteolibacter luteus]QJE96928.1 hypothetical protein HHL09_14410 [Luteolibacter luteus]